MKENIKTLAFIIILAGFSAFLLTGARNYTNPRYLSNKKAEEVKNILSVLGIQHQEGAGTEELLKVFGKSVTEKSEGDASIYTSFEDEAKTTVKAIAYPFTGPGLWGPVKGLLALKPDMKTIYGIRFYEQEETPGLGGEIGAGWFADQFKDKTIVDSGDRPGIRIAGTGGASGDNVVSGISGATMTCDKVEDMLNELIMSIHKER